MSRPTTRGISASMIISVLVLLCAGALTWWWFDTMERRWTSVAEPSEAARNDPMLAAAMLLRQNAHPVQLAGSLGELGLVDLPDGTLLMGDGMGVVGPLKTAQLLAWIRRGNTLITQPRWLNAAEQAALRPASQAPPGRVPDDDDDIGDDSPRRTKGTRRKPLADLVEVDPIAALLGVRTTYAKPMPMCDRLTAPEPGKNCRTNEALRPPYHVALPGTDTGLELEHQGTKLVTLPGAAQPVLHDADAEAVRVYRVGKGQVVMLSQNFFHNYALNRYDHGELLLALAALHPVSKRVTIIKNFNAVAWYAALWRYASLMLISVAVSLALLLWMALRRFGPLLPAPLQVRRSLSEHIAASGAWLWKADGGRDLLLAAARADTLTLIQRRAPALLRGAPESINQALASACDISPASVDAALHQGAAHQPVRFTGQIRTLQIMRKHYERL